MDAEELLQRYAAGERDFSRISLRRINLQGIKLNAINLSDAELYNAYLKSQPEHRNRSGVNFLDISWF